MSTRFTKAGYPRRSSPRLRYRRPHHLQDTVLLELELPASAIPWLEHFGRWAGQDVERAAIYLLTRAMIAEQAAMHADDGRCVHGGRQAKACVIAAVDAFLAEPVNCGPSVARAKKFQRTFDQIHGAEG